MLTFFYSTGFGGSSNFGFFIVPGLPRPIRAASEFLKSSPSFTGSALAGAGIFFSSIFAGGNLGLSSIFDFSTGFGFSSALFA